MDPFVEDFLAKIKDQGLTIVEQIEKPWGVSVRLSDHELERFIELYYQGVELPQFDPQTSQSPKFLIVAPHKRFSWQVHGRRWEIWRIAKGPLGVYTSETDEHPEDYQVIPEGDVLTIHDHIRHRALGLDNWAVIAEIWIHKDAQNPSDEEDIVRLADDFGR